VSDASTFDPSSIDVSSAVTLIVARRSGATGYKGWRIPLHTDVATELRSICATTLVALGERTTVAYADDLDFDPESQYLLVPSDVLVAHRPESRRGRRPANAPVEVPQIEVDAGARRILADASSLDDLDASQLKRQSFAFYAAVVGDDPDHRVAFVDKWNPYKAGLSGQLATFFGDRLRRIEGPLLVFERSFDMVVTDAAIAVLNPTAFEGVFRDIDTMTARYPVWSDAAVAALPLHDATAVRLRELCGKGGRIAAQLRGLYERGVFKTAFKSSALRAEMKRQNLGADRLLVNGKLVLEDADIPIVLKLVDEKLYRGWVTDTRWDVGTRSAREA
jgi:hypothetical protein